MKAIVNPITRITNISIDDCTYQLTFDSLDSWNSFEHQKQIYDVHFHYDEQMWFSIYEIENYEKRLNYEVVYIYKEIE